MNIVEMVKKKWNMFWYGSEVRKVKVTVRDLQANVLRIQEAMTKVQKDINELTVKMDAVDRESEGERETYARLHSELQAKHELYGVLQKEMEQEYTNVKKLRDGKFMMAPKDALMIGGLIFVGTFAIALERENPKALKLCGFLLKTLFPLHIG